MSQFIYDPCLLYNIRPFSVIGLQTNDTLFIGDNEFVKQEQLQLQKAKFLAKERKRLTFTHNLKFNSGIIYLKNDSNSNITLTQEQ